MAYARQNEESDLYVFSTGNELVCAGCLREKSTDYHTASRREMIEHLRDHVAKGDRVPKEAFDRLSREMMMESVFYIWSVEHQGYWRQNRCGYTPEIDEAGKFDGSEAIKICNSANLFKTEEMMVPVKGDI